MEETRPVNVVRVGINGRFPKKVLVILRTNRECEQVMQNAEKTTLPDNIWISRDRTWNQREEARLLREEKEKEENQEASQRGRPRGAGKGPGRPKGTAVGSVRGRGSGSRKRRMSGEEEEVKWRRTGGYGMRGGRGGTGGYGMRGGRGGRGGRGSGRGASTRGGNNGPKTSESDASRNPHSTTPNLPKTPVISGLVTPEAPSQPQRAADQHGASLPSSSNATLEAAGKICNALYPRYRQHR